MIKLITGILTAAFLMLAPGYVKASSGSEAACINSAEFVNDYEHLFKSAYSLSVLDSERMIAEINKRRAVLGKEPVQANKFVYAIGDLTDGSKAVYWALFNNDCIVHPMYGKVTVQTFADYVKASGINEKPIEFQLGPKKAPGKPV